MYKRLLRLFYAIEYLIAVSAFVLLWSQVAGQGHMDLVYWYWKLGIALCAGYAIVRATQSALNGDRAWNGRTVRWLSALVVLMVAAGLVSYYGHLYYEDQGSDEEDQQEPVTIHGAGLRGLQANSASARSISARI